MVKEPLEITVGGAGPYDPAAGQPDCLIPVLKGRQLVIERRNFGTLKKAEWTPLTEGGFRLAGVNFLAGEVYFVRDVAANVYAGPATYTNGFNYPEILTALFGRIGWRQGSLDGSPVPTAENAESRSGRFFNDFHALCTLQNFKKVLEDADATDQEINDELEALQISAIMSALNGVLNEPEVVERGFDFVTYGEQNNRPVDNTGQFIGRRITPARLDDRATQVSRVGLYFDRDVTFPLYLFQENRQAPLLSMDVTAIGWQKTLIYPVDWILSFLGPSHLGGAYYLGYFQEDLGDAKAIHETNYMPSSGFSWGMEFIQRQKTGAERFDRSVLQSSAYTGGLNVELIAFTDWTPMVVQNARHFDELIGLTVAANVVERAIYSTNSNETERIIKGQLQGPAVSDLTGAVPVPDGPKISGLRTKIERELKRVKQSFFKTPRGITYDSLLHDN